MTYVPPDLSEVEWQLLNAWGEMTKVLARRGSDRIVARQLRAGFRDVLAFSGVCREFHADAVAAFEAMSHAPREIEAHKAFVLANIEAYTAKAQRLASAMKALFFFGRSLQDACYRALLEVHGETAGPRSSMAKGVKHPRIGQLIEAETPGYEAWFTIFRDTRNRMKYGVTDGQSLRFQEPKLVQISLADGPYRGSGSRAATFRTITLLDADELLRRSALVLQLLARLWLKPAGER